MIAHRLYHCPVQRKKGKTPAGTEPFVDRNQAYKAAEANGLA
jgi:hypothetical protein